MIPATLDSTLGLAASGFVLGFGLIAAIGAQNAFILRQGVRRQHLLAVLLVCAASDIALILGGILGVGAILDHAPWVVTLVRWFGVAFLTTYGLMAARRAWRPSGHGLTAAEDGLPGGAPAADDLPASGGRADAASAVLSQPTAPLGSTATLTAPVVEAVPTRTRVRSTLATAVLTALAFTWLNPHTYLDTVVVLGSVANTYGETARWVFGAGAIVASFAWFTLLGFGARALASKLASPKAWRVLDAFIAVVMLTLAASLAFAH